MSIEQNAKLEAQKLMAEMGLAPTEPSVTHKKTSTSIDSLLEEIKQLQQQAQHSGDARRTAKLIREAQTIASDHLRWISSRKEKLKKNLKILVSQYQTYEKHPVDSNEQEEKQALADRIKKIKADHQRHIKNAVRLRDQFNQKKVKKPVPKKEVDQLISEISALQIRTGKAALSPQEIALLTNRITHVEDRQRNSREQINQLAEAKIKYELALVRSSREKDKQQQKRANDNQIHQHLNNLIESKDKQQQELLEELKIIRLHSAQEAALLRTQRDAAKAMTNKEIENQKYRKKHKKPYHVLLMGTFIGLCILSILMVGIMLFTPIGEKLQAKWLENQAPAIAETHIDNDTKDMVNPVIQAIKKVKKPVKITAYKDKLINGQQAPRMLLLPEGEFVMGSPAYSPHTNAQPQHRVQIPSFAISQDEITFAQYRLFTVATQRLLPKDNGWGREQRPVINVKWTDAVAYTEWLSQQTRHDYRLPSERQWEYAARANNNNRFGWGNKIRSNRAVCALCGSQWDNKSTAEVGQFAPNDFGLRDMIGNVMEWTRSCYHLNYQNAPVFGEIWSGGDCTKRVVRGSAFNSYQQALSLAARYQYSENSRSNNLGFRVVRVD